MPTHPSDDKQLQEERRLAAKAQYEIDDNWARVGTKEGRAEDLRKFEEGKAWKAKHKPGPPWTAEMWQAHAADVKAGVVEPERRFPIIINDNPTTPSTFRKIGPYAAGDPLTTEGPFTTLEKLQKIAGPPSLPDVQSTTMATDGPEPDGGSKGSSDGGQKLRYTHVNYDQLARITAASDHPFVEVIIWFEGTKRIADMVRSVGQKNRSTAPNHAGKGQSS